MLQTSTLARLLLCIAPLCNGAIQTATGFERSTSRTDYLEQQVRYLAGVATRLTGSPNHNTFINHVQSQLRALGLEVHTDELPFTYYDGPLSEPKLTVSGKDVAVTSYSKYSGFTDARGVSGELVDLTTSSLAEEPAWEKARGKLALTNITNVASNPAASFIIWPGSPEWSIQTGSPDSSATAYVHNLTHAADAGVKGVVYAWQNASTGLVDGQWTPFRQLYQGVPTLFVQGTYGTLDRLVDAAKNGARGTLTLEAKMKPHTPTRNFWVVIEGTELKNESVIINTHTDGTNIVEENGHIALLVHAKHLVAHPPRRTHVLLFVGQHMNFAAFSPSGHRATDRWMATHPEYWAGQGQTNAFDFGGQLKAVAASCVEHMGAIEWVEDIKKDTWSPTDRHTPELLYASTAELNNLTRKHWVGANPKVTRVNNPAASKIGQAGEGLAFFLNDIPNISLVTAPIYLLKIWPRDFDQTRLIDIAAMDRQITSFQRLWKAMDSMAADEFGKAVSSSTG